METLLCRPVSLYSMLHTSCSPSTTLLPVFTRIAFAYLVLFDRKHASTGYQTASKVNGKLAFRVCIGGATPFQARKAVRNWPIMQARASVAWSTILAGKRVRPKLPLGVPCSPLFRQYWASDSLMQLRLLTVRYSICSDGMI
jgi:hypothetical protein